MSELSTRDRLRSEGAVLTILYAAVGISYIGTRKGARRLKRVRRWWGF